MKHLASPIYLIGIFLRITNPYTTWRGIANPTLHLIPRCIRTSLHFYYLFEADKRKVHENQNIKEQLIFCTKCHINTLKKTYFPAKTT